MKDYEIKKEIVEVAHLMSDKDLVGTYEGNISVIRGERLYLTPSHQDKKQLNEGKIIVTDLEGKLLEGELTPTSETPMHTAVYKMRPDVGAVIHCHAPYSTAYALANIPIVCTASPEFTSLFDKVPVLPYGTPGTNDIFRGLEEELREHDAVLLGNHGLLVVGKTVRDAFAKTLSLEMLVKTIVIAKMVSNRDLEPLPDSECEKLRKMGEPFRGNQLLRDKH